MTTANYKRKQMQYVPRTKGLGWLNELGSWIT